MILDEAEPLISVIVPVYNVEKYLDQCVESILGQTYHNLEIILIDDGSPDRSGQMCDEWAAKNGRVRAIHQENAGSGPARNAGLAVARGALIAFADPDDWLMPNAMETLWRNMTAENAEVSSVGTLMVEPHRRYSATVADTYLVMRFPETFKYVNLRGYLDFFIWGKLYRRSLFDGLSFPPGRSQDLPVTYTVLERAMTVVLDSTALWCYRQHTESISHQARSGSHPSTDYTRAMLDRVREICPQYEPYATWKHMQRAAWDYQLLLQTPPKLWNAESREFAVYVCRLMRDKSGYVRQALAADPLAQMGNSEYLRYWLIGHAPWLFRPIYRAYVKLRRDRAS